MGPLVLRHGPLPPGLLDHLPAALPRCVVLPAPIPHRVPELPQFEAAFVLLVVLSPVVRDDVLVTASAIGGVLLEAGVGAGFVGTVKGTELHVVAQLGHPLGTVVDVGAAVVSHDIGVPASAGGRVVDGAAFAPQESAVVVLVDHHLILLHPRQSRQPV